MRSYKKRIWRRKKKKKTKKTVNKKKTKNKIPKSKEKNLRYISLCNFFRKMKKTS